MAGEQGRRSEAEVGRVEGRKEMKSLGEERNERLRRDVGAKRGKAREK